MHDTGPGRIDVPQCALARLPPFAPAANLSTPGMSASDACNEAIAAGSIPLLDRVSSGV
jgi:hypothetical protein